MAGVYTGMRALALVLLLCAMQPAARASVTPPDGLADAAAARALLGDLGWVRVARIENSGAHSWNRRSPYPRVVYATVFELSGILWFYTDTDGTQSLSLTRNTVARDEAAPGPLFRAIDPGFAAWSWVGERELAGRAIARRPPNACFVESVSFLLRRMMSGQETRSPELLSYYVDTPFGRLGHTVLVFSTARGIQAADPEVSASPVEIPPWVGAEPGALSAYLRGRPVSAARALPVSCGRQPPPELYATVPSQAPGAG